MKVWIKGKDQPGLSMARAIGDKIAASVGVSCEPGKLSIYIVFICLEIGVNQLLRQEFMYALLIGSDGLWNTQTTIGIKKQLKEMLESY